MKSPDKFLDTLYLHAGDARSALAEVANEIEVELNLFYDKLSSLTSTQTIHGQLDAKRLSDLQQFKLRGAVFDVLHADDLEEECNLGLSKIPSL